jgi:hypothetical protein
MTDEELSMSIPLDDDEFLRRERPTCEREFKWLVSAEDEETEPPSGGYFCPYCGVQAPPDAWHTKAQIALAENRMMREVVGPQLRKLERELRGIGRASGGLVQGRMDTQLPPEADPLTETNDMRRVDFTCHPTEPVKIAENRSQPPFCLICGQPSA